MDAEAVYCIIGRNNNRWIIETPDLGPIRSLTQNSSVRYKAEIQVLTLLETVPWKSYIPSVFNSLVDILHALGHFDRLHLFAW
jgi:hypothetical protein